MLATSLTASTASADPYCAPAFRVPLPSGPDARGPGFYAACPGGMVYGPNYWLRPPTEPFNGPVFLVGQKIMSEKLGAQAAPPPAFPTNPYIRGPRKLLHVAREPGRPEAP